MRRDVVSPVSRFATQNDQTGLLSALKTFLPRTYSISVLCSKSFSNYELQQYLVECFWKQISSDCYGESRPGSHTEKFA